MMLLVVLLVGVCMGPFPHTAGLLLRQEPLLAEFSTSECTNLVCEQAHEQAKGLSKLALLDEFVSQTVFLLNDLMKNIDGELEKSASSLLRYIHPNCSPTRKILEEVINKQRQKKDKVSKDLSQGIDPMPEDNLGKVEPHDKSDGIEEADDDGWPSYDRSSDRKYESSGGTEDFDGGSSSVSKPSGGFFNGPQTNHGTRESRKNQSNSQAGGFFGSRDNSHGRQLGKKWSQKEDTTTTGSWTGVYQRPNKASENGKKSSGRNVYEKKEIPKTTPSRGKTLISNRKKEPEPQNEGCRGVNKGSAFWTPGLDSWCKNNCSKGYCPKTHCRC